MYDKIAKITNIKHKTTLVIPGITHIISNQQWKDLMTNKIKRADLIIITDEQKLELEY